VQLCCEYIRSQQRHLMRQWHTWIQGRGWLDPQCSALSQQRRYRILLRLRHAATEIPRPTVLVVGGGARALAFLASAARSLRRICSGEQLRQGRTRRRGHRHRILRHSSRLGSRLPSRCDSQKRSLESNTNQRLFSPAGFSRFSPKEKIHFDSKKRISFAIDIFIPHLRVRDEHSDIYEGKSNLSSTEDRCPRTRSHAPQLTTTFQVVKDRF